MKSDAIGAALGARILRTTALGGGCINHAAKIETSRGVFFAKWNDAPPPAMFEREAACLEALRSANSSLAIPEVIAFSNEFLVTELLEPGPRVKDFDERLGRGLAELHRASADAFGFETDTYCGTTLQPNPRTDRWVDFYREHRLGHQLRLLRSAIGKSDAERFEKLLDRLPDLLGPEEGPALIHGDLWSGNLHVTRAGLPALIDPASYYAHREAELGMMTLFGGFGARVYDAYSEAFPLDPGWRERNPLYQLYHVANHATLFGGGYAGQMMGIVRRYV
jgi:fructosamine-3-kinase